MIDSIAGIILMRTPTSVVVKVMGLGLRLEVTPATVRSLPIKKRVLFFTRLWCDGGESRLFGFLNIEERTAFNELVLPNSGIGPIRAMEILNAKGADAVGKAIGSGSAQVIMQLLGLGRKTARRLATLHRWNKTTLKRK